MKENKLTFYLFILFSYCTCVYKHGHVFVFTCMGLNDKRKLMTYSKLGLVGYTLCGIIIIIIIIIIIFCEVLVLFAKWGSPRFLFLF
jgi:hypothetical protein